MEWNGIISFSLVHSLRQTWIQKKKKYFHLSKCLQEMKSEWIFVVALCCFFFSHCVCILYSVSFFYDLYPLPMLLFWSEFQMVRCSICILICILFFKMKKKKYTFLFFVFRSFQSDAENVLGKWTGIWKKKSNRNSSD